MKFLTLLFLIALTCLLPNTAEAQAMTPITITYLDGSQLEGQVPSNKMFNGPGRRFTLITAGGDKVKIKASDVKIANVRGAVYESHQNDAGNHVFMLRIADGPKVVLLKEVIESYSSAMGHSVYAKYYILRGNRPQYINRDNLKAYPQVYFPGNDALCEEIRNTRIKDFKISEWATRYNLEE